MNNFILFISFIIGVILATIITCLALKSKTISKSKFDVLADEKNKINTQLALSEEKIKNQSEEIVILKSELKAKTDEYYAANNILATFKADNRALQEKLETQKSEIEDLQKRLTTEFENIATKILKERSAEFSESNHKNLSEILNPLKEKIQLFEKKVDETYDKELRDKISLKEEVRKLTELNARVSEEANNLTKALKGDVKKQGNWGEVILERVLERSGLTRGQEYEREEVIEGVENQTQRPDIIIHLPENKHIVIDSKVSLIAYERMISEENDERKEKFLKEHIASMRSHVKLLSEKNYQNAFNINTPDFVLMFLPIEPSFSVAVQHDAELFSYAFDRKIVIVSPTTLLATLRTIASIWKQENQTKNAQEIARLSGMLYDKFVGFSEDLSKIKLNIDRASGAYDDAIKKLKSGNGNIIRTAEKIKELGAKTNKSLPSELIEDEVDTIDKQITN
ncbi:MAG: DNA recombination protein RmuC [Dysgonamonadaceae bacterium]|nr:DNA recombination protein RmuC [Dysgonamonadaceae bacterium]